MNAQRTLHLYIVTLCLSLCLGCTSQDFSLSPEELQFQQTSDPSQSKIDILWVIDNTGSMLSSQENLAANMEAFMEDFISKGYDFQMAVTTTDSYWAEIDDNPELSAFTDGTFLTGYSGHPIVTSETPHLLDVFIHNVRQGIHGYADERPFASFKSALNNPLNEGFLREDAYLSIIILSDDDDFSHDGPEFRGGQYSYQGLLGLNDVIEYLDDLKGAFPVNRKYRYNVSMIGVLDEDCLKSLMDTEFQSRKIAFRTMNLAYLTNGVMADICGNFSEELKSISSRLIELATRFSLNRVPFVPSLKVFVEDNEVPLIDDSKDVPNPSGFRYHAESNSISIHGDYIPRRGENVFIRYDPVTL